MNSSGDGLPVQARGVAGCRGLTRGGGTRSEWTNLSLPCLTEPSQVDLGRLRGDLTVLNLWASWCGPCRKEMPVLEQASQDYPPSVKFVGVATRDGARVAGNFLADTGVSYPQVFDGRGQLLAQERIPGLPVTLLVDSRGKVIDRHVGPFDRQALDAFVKPALSTAGP